MHEDEEATPMEEQEQEQPMEVEDDTPYLDLEGDQETQAYTSSRIASSSIRLHMTLTLSKR